MCIPVSKTCVACLNGAAFCRIHVRPRCLAFSARPSHCFSHTQVMALEENVEEFGLPYFGMGDKRQGIVHIIGPEQGFTIPGATCVCGDSHTATHGAFGALAFGIGTSEVKAQGTLRTMPPLYLRHSSGAGGGLDSN